MTFNNERKRKEADMTETYPRQVGPSLSSIAGSLRSRWLSWRAFEKLVFELRTKSDDELRDAGLDPTSRRWMARKAIYGE